MASAYSTASSAVLCVVEMRSAALCWSAVTVTWAASAAGGPLKSIASAARSGTSPVVANSWSWLNACGSVNTEPAPVELDTSSVWLAFHVVTESAACSGSGSPAMTAPAMVKITTIHQNRRRASVGRVPFTVGRDYRVLRVWVRRATRSASIGTRGPFGGALVSAASATRSHLVGGVPDSDGASAWSLCRSDCDDAAAGDRARDGWCRVHRFAHGPGTSCNRP